MDEGVAMADGGHIPSTTIVNSGVSTIGGGERKMLKASNSISSNKTMISEKIRELEVLRENSLAKMDDDIAALRHVLLIM